jgi:phage shock protein A
MKWLDRFTLVMRSSLTTLRETVEDPERMLHQLIIDMEMELERVRESVAEAIADEILLGKRTQKARDEADRWLDRATASLKRNDEATAKAALEQKVTAEQPRGGARFGREDSRRPAEADSALGAADACELRRTHQSGIAAHGKPFRFRAIQPT